MTTIARSLVLVLVGIDAVGLTRRLGSNAIGQEGRKRPDGSNGRWTGRITGTPHGDMAMGLSLKQEGTKVTGTLTTDHTGDLPVEGELQGRTLKLSTTGNAEPQLTLTGTLKDEGTLGGTLSSQMGDMTWSAERVKDKP